MKTFKQFLHEIIFTKPNSNLTKSGAPDEHDEVKHQGIRGDLQDKIKFRNALRMGKKQVIPAYKFRQGNLQNTDAGSSRPIRDFTKLDQNKQRRVNNQVASGKVTMPISTTVGGKHHLLAGNTRATKLASQNKPTTVLKIKNNSDNVY